MNYDQFAALASKTNEQLVLIVIALEAELAALKSSPEDKAFAKLMALPDLGRSGKYLLCNSSNEVLKSFDENEVTESQVEGLAIALSVGDICTVWYQLSGRLQLRSHWANGNKVTVLRRVK